MKVVGIGAGGHARVIVDILRLRGEHELVGVTTVDRELWSRDFEGLAVLGDDSVLTGLRADGVEGLFIGVGSIGKHSIRERLFGHGRSLSFTLVDAIHPTAILASSVRHGVAFVAAAGSIANPGAVFGDNVILNTGAIVDHDCQIGDHVHIATGARLSGSVIVGDGAHIGTGACVRQGVSIGAGAVVGAGAAVVREVSAGTVVVGVPAGPLVH